MASHDSALKAHRQSLRRRAVNRANISTLRSQLKKFRTVAAAGDPAETQKLLPETISVIDMSARKGVLHANAAARHKSRLTRLASKAKAEPKPRGKKR